MYAAVAQRIRLCPDDTMEDMAVIYDAQGGADVITDAVLKITEDRFVKNEFEQVNDLLEWIDTDRIGEVLAIEMLLRSTYRFRFVLSHWNGALARGKKTMAARKAPADIFLTGLD